MTTEAAGRENTQLPRTRGRRRAGCSPTALVRMAGRPRQRLAPANTATDPAGTLDPLLFVTLLPSRTKARKAQGLLAITPRPTSPHFLRSTLTSPAGALVPLPAVLSPPAGAVSCNSPLPTPWAR